MVVFVIITLFLSLIAAICLVEQTKVKVACFAGKNTGTDVMNHGGYTVLCTMVFFATMFVIGYLSKFPVISCILALAASIALVMANTYLKGKKIHVTLAMIALWFGVFYASFKDSGLVLSFTTKAFKASNWWVKAYIVLQLICGALILVGTAVANYRNYYGINKRKNRKRTEARPLTPTEERKIIDKNDMLGLGEDFKLGNFLVDNAQALLSWLFIIMLVILYAFLCVWLEVKFDFFPPYR